MLDFSGKSNNNIDPRTIRCDVKNLPLTKTANINIPAIHARHHHPRNAKARPEVKELKNIYRVMIQIYYRKIYAIIAVLFYLIRIMLNYFELFFARATYDLLCSINYIQNEHYCYFKNKAKSRHLMSF